jgi:uncharacterized protein YraI
MECSHAMIGFASLVGAALMASPASAVTAYSPTGHLNVRSGPGFQYPVVAQMAPNEPAAVTGCISNYTWCGVAIGGVTGWASAEYLVTDAGGKLTNLQVSGAQLGITIVCRRAWAPSSPPHRLVRWSPFHPPSALSSRSCPHLIFSPT